MTQTACRFCGSSVDAVFADLGMSPLANSYLPPEAANSMEAFYRKSALADAKSLFSLARGLQTAGKWAI